MCGICFAWRPDLSEADLSRVMDRSLDLIAHRGPDDSGRVVQRPWALGNRRLSIIDLPGGHQPLSDATGRYHISYNGELYNYRELRRQLSDVWNFVTRGDTEVVLAGLVSHGVDFLRLMEGMWGLAVWDQDEQALLLVRDRMGQKPLYYQSDVHHFACASELPALRALSWRGWQEDLHSTADYFRFGYCLPGTTAYKQVHELLPGHWLRWSPGQGVVQQPYWRLSPGGFHGSRSQAGEMLQTAIVQGIERRLVSDVEVGALLSGGVDSSLVAAITTQRLNQKLKTFTMGFEDHTFDERRYARRIARHCGSRHFDDCLTLVHSEDLVRHILGKVGQPFADGSILPTALVCRMAADHVKVVISGDGGDELFCGYQRYLGRALLRWYTRLPDLLRAPARRLILSFPEPGAHHSASLLKKAHLFLDAADRMGHEAPYIAPSYYTPEMFQQLLPAVWRKGHRPPLLPRVTTLDDLHQMMVADALIYLPQDILAKVDRASMAYSLEVRSPFLDRRIVELALCLPRHWHRIGVWSKRMLHSAFGDLLPGWVWQRRKHGFGIPVHQWFRQGLAQRLTELLHQSEHPLGVPMVQRLVQEHTAGHRDHGQRLWQIYVYLQWVADRSWQ